MTVDDLITHLQQFPKSMIIFSGSEGGPYELSDYSIRECIVDENLLYCMGGPNYTHPAIKIGDKFLEIGG